MHTHTNALIICSIFELIFQLKNTFIPYWLRSTFTQRRNTSSGQRVPLQCVAIKLINIEFETRTPSPPPPIISQNEHTHKHSQHDPSSPQSTSHPDRLKTWTNKNYLNKKKEDPPITANYMKQILSDYARNATHTTLLLLLIVIIVWTLEAN